MEYVIFTEAPKDFNPTVEAAGCYCEFKNSILLLKRHPSRPQGNTWGVPGGKLEEGEDARAAVIREVWEEVGINIADEGLQEMGRLYIRLPYVDYVFHLFRKRFLVCPYIILELKEHLEARWVSVPEALQLPLISGGKEALEFYKKFMDM